MATNMTVTKATSINKDDHDNNGVEEDAVNDDKDNYNDDKDDDDGDNGDNDMAKMTTTMTNEQRR